MTRQLLLYLIDILYQSVGSVNTSGSIRLTFTPIQIGDIFDLSGHHLVTGRNAKRLHLSQRPGAESNDSAPAFFIKITNRL